MSFGHTLADKERYVMREVTKEMIREFDIKKIGYDFMGYTFKRKEDLSFHHLIVAKRNCKNLGLGQGYLFWNGAILTQHTAHDYLHIIERVDPTIFYDITSELIDENVARKIKIENLKHIREMLLTFEREHCSDTNGKGKYLIKPIYIDNRIKLD